MAKVTNWGQAVDYTFQTRHTWRHGTGRKTSLINTNHFTRLRGRSFPLSKINQANVNQVCIELEEEGKSDGTINRVVSAVSTVMNHCAFDGLISAAPKLRRRREAEARQTWFTKDDVEALYHSSLDPFQRDDLADIILIAAYTGCRQGELLTIKAQDVDLVSNLLHIGGRPGFTTKAANYRTIPIHERILPVIEKRMEHAGAGVRLLGDEWNDKDQLLRAFRKVRNFCGKGDEYVFHSLRHSFGTWCAQAGVPIRTIMDMMGHKRIETTLRYAKVSDAAKTDAMLRI